jgi:hypothetical protein
VSVQVVDSSGLAQGGQSSSRVKRVTMQRVGLTGVLELRQSEENIILE